MFKLFEGSSSHKRIDAIKYNFNKIKSGQVSAIAISNK